jgi:hypothetical protein
MATAIPDNSTRPTIEDVEVNVEEEEVNLPTTSLNSWNSTSRPRSYSESSGDDHDARLLRSLEIENDQTEVLDFESM